MKSHQQLGAPVHVLVPELAAVKQQNIYTFMSHSTEQVILKMCSSEPISWLTTKENKPNTNKVNNTRTT